MKLVAVQWYTGKQRKKQMTHVDMWCLKSYRLFFCFEEFENHEETLPDLGGVKRSVGTWLELKTLLFI